MIRWADSFDHYGATKANLLDGSWAEIATAVDLSTAQARTGTRSLLISGTNGRARRVWGAALLTAGIGAAWFFDSLPPTNHQWRIYGFQDSNNKPQVTIYLDSTGIFSAYRGSGINEPVVLLGFSDSESLLTPRGWNHIEAKVKCHPSAGSIELRLNGVTIMSLTGINTVNSVAPALGESSSSQVYMGVTQNTTGTNAYVDDVIAWDDTGDLNNDFIGDKKVFTDFPDADGSLADWTPSTGSAEYAMIDDPDPDADGTYDQATTSGDQMQVTFPDVNAATVSIASIILVHKSKKTDAGVCNIQVSAERSGSADDGRDRPMTAIYTNYLDSFEQDPSTAAPWTKGGANAMSAIIERTS